MGLAVMLASKLAFRFFSFYNRVINESACFIRKGNIHHDSSSVNELFGHLVVWSFGGLVVWFFRPGSDADAQKAVVDFQSSCAAAEPLG